MNPPDEEAFKKDLKNYQELERINKSDEFNKFFQLQIELVAGKMFDCFTGKGPQNWDEFCRLRGEIVAYLYPIQHVRGAKAMKDHLTKQLDNFYNKQAE